MLGQNEYTPIISRRSSTHKILFIAVGQSRAISSYLIWPCPLHLQHMYPSRSTPSPLHIGHSIKKSIVIDYNNDSRIKDNDGKII